jgi:hypothetical protein
MPPPPIRGYLLHILAHPHDSPSLDVHLCYAILKLPYRYTEWSASRHGRFAPGARAPRSPVRLMV